MHMVSYYTHTHSVTAPTPTRSVLGKVIAHRVSSFSTQSTAERLRKASASDRVPGRSRYATQHAELLGGKQWQGQSGPHCQGPADCAWGSPLMHCMLGRLPVVGQARHRHHGSVSQPLHCLC